MLQVKPHFPSVAHPRTGPHYLLWSMALWHQGKQSKLFMENSSNWVKQTEFPKQLHYCESRITPQSLGRWSSTCHRDKSLWPCEKHRDGQQWVVERSWWRCLNNHPKGWYRHSDTQMWLWRDHSTGRGQNNQTGEVKGWGLYTQLSSLGSGFSYIGSFQRQNWSQAIICITSFSEVWAPTCLSCFSPVVLYQVIIVSVAFQTSWWWVGRTGQCDPRTRSQGCLQHCPICCSVENTALKIKVEALPKQDLFFKKRKQL